MLDQFYWAERMFWLGVAPEPVKRHHLVPDDVDETSINEAVESLSEAIQYALSPKVKTCAKEIAERISAEVMPIKTFFRPCFTRTIAGCAFKSNDWLINCICFYSIITSCWV